VTPTQGKPRYEEDIIMKLSNWMKAATLIIAVSFGLVACNTVKPVNTFSSTLDVTAPTTVVVGGEQFTFTAILTYNDGGEQVPLSNQTVQFLGTEFGINDEYTTDAEGRVVFDVVAPLLPEREMERDAWIRVHFSGSVIEFRDMVGRFRDSSNSRYFTIKQSAPGRNNPGIPG
jgi:hypothetical protein